MIERIEVLRDGAAAQYGSDAIAGVINIVLKGSASGEASAHVRSDGRRRWPGRRTSRPTPAACSGSRTTSTSGVEYRDRGFTNRAGIDPRTQYFAGDPRNACRSASRCGSATRRRTDVLGMLNGVVHDEAGASSSTRSAARAIATASRPRTGDCLTATTPCARSGPTGFCRSINTEHLGRLGRGRREGNGRSDGSGT